MLVVSIVLISVFSYGFSDEEVGAKIGAYAPNVTLTEGTKTVDIEKYRGEYLLLAFWASYDADSRIRSNEYGAFISSSKVANSEESINFLSINFDEKEVLFREIVRLDNMSNDSQIFARECERSQIDKFYNLKSGYKSYLIDCNGKIVAINPTISELNAIYH